MCVIWSEFERYFPCDAQGDMELVHSITGERVTCMDQLIPSECYALRPKTRAVRGS